MKFDDLCELCGRPEKGYSVTETNLKLRKVAKGPARREVESFICSRCVQLSLKSGMTQDASKLNQVKKSAGQ